MNQITSWLDNSNVYGSDHETLRRLRQNVDGLMDHLITTEGEELLPYDDELLPDEKCRDGTECLLSGIVTLNTLNS